MAFVRAMGKSEHSLCLVRRSAALQPSAPPLLLLPYSQSLTHPLSMPAALLPPCRPCAQQFDQALIADALRS